LVQLNQKVCQETFKVDLLISSSPTRTKTASAKLELSRDINEITWNATNALYNYKNVLCVLGDLSLSYVLFFYSKKFSDYQDTILSTLSTVFRNLLFVFLL